MEVVVNIYASATAVRHAHCDGPYGTFVHYMSRNSDEVVLKE